MGTRSLSADTVGMSEILGVAVLVGLTLTVTAVVGVNVLVLSEEDSGGPEANFSYDYVESSNLLLVTHQEGDQLEAGKVEFEGRGQTVTWAELANWNETEKVGPGDLTQLGEDNPYGSRVTASDTITIYYNDSGNRTELDKWEGAV